MAHCVLAAPVPLWGHERLDPRESVRDFLDSAEADIEMAPFYVGCALGVILKVGLETATGVELMDMVQAKHKVVERIFLPPQAAPARKKKRGRG